MSGVFLTGLYFFLLSFSFLLLQIRDALGRALEVKTDLEGRLDRKNHVVQELLARIDKLEQLVEGGAGKATSSAPHIPAGETQATGENQFFGSTYVICLLLIGLISPHHLPKTLAPCQSIVVWGILHMLTRIAIGV